ncbi:MAG: hypothetical protein JWM31_3452, partial [Solirubrobacterales bacterium]|nr:hypothetical protein [Solirubrobacterales bacterium]
MDSLAVTALLQRVRWSNLARLAALAGVALLAFLWPRLSSAPPPVPATAPVPLTRGPAAVPVVREQGTTSAAAPTGTGTGTG